MKRLTTSLGIGLLAASIFAPAMAPTPASASIGICDRAIIQCYASCAKRPIGKDVCYRRCDVAYVNCK